MRIPPPFLALGAGVAQGLLARGSGRPTGARSVGAAVLATGSMTLAGSAFRTFRRVGTTVDPLEPEQATVLVTTGPHGVTRNPMYLGLAGLLLAHALVRGSWRALLPVAVFAALIDRFQVAVEESALRAHFGEEYEAYCAAVPRWVDRRSVDALVARNGGAG
jgi:protein-S-isoprenylcysteine O-methyltransferase Ste14